MKILARSIIGGLACMAALIYTPAYAGPGDLLVSPVRVVFEGRERVAEVTLVNKGETPATYRISFENRRMNRDGSFAPITEAGEGELFSDSYVRFAPRRVDLEPNAPQTLRLMLRKPADLGDGEYRSHLHLAAIPDDAGSASIEAGEGDANAISIQLTPVYGVTIPIIVRHGVLEADAKITTADYVRTSNGGGELKFTFERTGTKSLYGDFTLHVEGRDEALMQMSGVALYTPNSARDMKISLPPEAAAIAAGKSLEIRFQDRTVSGTDLFASAVIGPLN
ncbi:MAG: molecular chaperone [Pseudomonadota bacterium]